MVSSEENMTNLKVTKTKVTVGDSKPFTGTKRGNWNGYQRRNVKNPSHDVI